MTAKTMYIRDLTRFPMQNNTDSLQFNPGVNVIVGPPNTGKTQWLKILDYLLGDDSPAEATLAEEVFEKYESVNMSVSIEGQDHTISRNWKEPGLKTKISIDGNSMNRKEFCYELLRLLDVPTVHYPQGDPYGPRSWPELGWRSLFRHIYRQQRFWTDLADQQYESEQHACLMQFMGIAKSLFSSEYGALVNSNKKIEELKLKREHFLSMLQEVSLELIGSQDLGVALTPQSIGMASDRIQKEISELQEKRRKLLEELLAAVTHQNQSVQKEMVQQLSEELVALQAEREALIVNLKKTDERLSDLKEYRVLVGEELSRIERTGVAGEILTAIKITHCPACDREISKSPINTNECLLCHRTIEPLTGVDVKPTRRLEFERHQLSAEYDEAEEIIAALDHDQKEIGIQIQKLNDRIHQIQAHLRPTRVATAAIMPPEIAIWDMGIGGLEERLKQLKRITESLNRREDISTQIAQVQEQVAELERKVAEQKSKIDFDREADVLADSMNSYLNLIYRNKPMLWSQKPIAVDFRRRDFKFFVGERNWKSKLGGTATLIFLMAYHYGLMSLSNRNDYNYPGLLILDFPAELDDGSTVRDKENFVLEPFIDLLGRDNMDAAQVIAAGSAFENLPCASRIEMHRIWK